MAKIDKRIKYRLVLDTETFGSIGAPKTYDIGIAVADKSGRIYETRSYMVAEAFSAPYYNGEMQSAYYADKFPAYFLDLGMGKRIMMSFFDIRKDILSIMEKYNISEVYAYNMGFDIRALNNSTRVFSNYEIDCDFFNDDVECFCLMNMAVSVFAERATYIRFCAMHNFFTDKGNIQVKAETMFRYLTNDPTFIESHTALEDVKIEVTIMSKCFKAHKAMDKSIKGNVWAKPQRACKEYRLKWGI